MIAVAGSGLSVVSSLKSGAVAADELQMARDFVAAGDRRTAILQIKSLLVRDPDHLEARIELARLYLTFEHGLLAKKEFERVRNTRYWDAAHECLWQRAALYCADIDTVVAHYAERSGKLSVDQAQAGFRAVLNIESGHVDALVVLSELALAQGNLPVAGERVSEAIALSSSMGRAREI
ncbi:MAG: hypothetical protein ACI9W2_004267 [Gammaproteobacteria bacterium]|jgi:hypothetical protein